MKRHPHAHDVRGRSTPRIKDKRHRAALGAPAGASWTWVTCELLGSAAWNAMSPAARRIVDRIMLEHLRHAGQENGHLKVTYNDFCKAHVRRTSIALAIAEVERLGLVEVMYRGRRLHGTVPGAAAQYRLTWLPIILDDGTVMAPTDEWKRFERAATLAERRDAADEALEEIRLARIQRETKCRQVAA